jgi:hypothetical protein
MQLPDHRITGGSDATRHLVTAKSNDATGCGGRGLDYPSHRKKGFHVTVTAQNLWPA